MASPALRRVERPWRLPEARQQVIDQVRRHLRHRVHGRHPNLQQDPPRTRRTPKTSPQGPVGSGSDLKHRQMQAFRHRDPIPWPHSHPSWLNTRSQEH